jgi:Tfp pilus assembly PilM family ATPase/Tfp pilus assembly protein PilN
MMRSGSEYISVSLTDETFKIARIKASATESLLLNVVRQDVKDVPEDELLKTVQSALGTIDVRRGNAVCCLSSALTTTKNIEIPSVDPEEIKSIIDLQAGRHTPYSREEILIGYINIGVHSRNYTKILLIIVNREVIKKQLAVLNAAGLKVDRVIFAPEVKAKYYAQMLKRQPGDKPIGIIDIGKYSTDFTIESSQTVITCRNIPLGMNQLLKEGEDAKQKLVAELAQSIEFYQTEDIDVMPEAYYLTSDDAKIKELQPLLQEKLKANVKINSFLDHIKAGQPVMLKIVSEYDDESFLDVVAVMNSGNDVQVDLTPEEIKMQRSIEEQSRQIVKLGVFSIILLVLIVCFFYSKIHFRNAYLANLSEEFAVKRQYVEDLESVDRNTRIIKEYLKSRMINLDVVDELYKKIPDEIYLKSINLADDGTIRLSGVSETRSTAFAFITILENSELFKNAKMLSSDTKKERGKDVSIFEISFKLNSAKDNVEEEIKPAEEESKEEEGNEEE